MRVLPGASYPLGATFDGIGTNFSLFSEVAEAVDLCLFDAAGHETRVRMPEYNAYCWHVYLPEVTIGQRYGYRVYGPYSPERGIRCCDKKLLLDPNAKAIEGQVLWNPALYLYRPESPEGPLNDADSAPYMPKCIVTNPFFDWQNDHRPRTSLHETIIYETHVKGFSMRNPDIQPELRGTYAGLAHPASIEYLTKLGVTAVELMPVHQFVHEERLIKMGLRNYWGYNTIGFFAPHNEYSSSGETGQQVQEFKQMVLELHKAGLEVILDVVYNHTAEGNHLGPVLSFKGVDNPSYYRLLPGNFKFYWDTTGTGNTLDMRQPNTLQMVMDSLRYWVTEMHVDGFRFDLAAALARNLHEVDWLGAFMAIMHQDPVISSVKLIAEPWDVGEGGYQVGNFPPKWSEWNGRYRDSVRDYWRGQDQLLRDFASRFTGSADMYAGAGKRPYASVNFVTAHDGFSLTDLVSYDHKHNDANGEGNRDGSDDNRSWNCGVEGPTDDTNILMIRGRQRRNFMATLLLSQGIPMILGGDELGRSKGGNNNSYCQDNELSWYDWESCDWDFCEFTCKLVKLRKEHPTFRRWRWLNEANARSRLTAIGFFKPDGEHMTESDWENGFAKAMQVFLNGMNILGINNRGEQVVDDDYLIMFNSHWERLEFKILQCIPAADACVPTGGGWRRVLDTSCDNYEDPTVYESGQALMVEGRSMVMLSRPR